MKKKSVIISIILIVLCILYTIIVKEVNTDELKKAITAYVEL